MYKKFFKSCIIATCADMGKFECVNHECIESFKRCDGVKDCSDGTDEYKCGNVASY